jgi:hypothetical protein
MMKKKLLLLILMLNFRWLHAQVLLAPLVMSPAGDVFNNGNISLSFTVAEMTMVETYTSGATVLNQGFQNAFWLPVALGVESHEANPFKLSLYPNPCNESFTLSTAGITDRLYVELTDPLGQTVISREVTLPFGTNVKVQVDNLSAGIYSLCVRDAEHNSKKIFTSKISIQH